MFNKFIHWVKKLDMQLIGTTCLDFLCLVNGMVNFLSGIRLFSDIRDYNTDFIFYHRRQFMFYVFLVTLDKY